MKKCYACKQEKEETEFNKNKSRKDGLNAACRSCSNKRSKLYYEDNKEKHIKEVQKRRKKVSDANKQKILDTLQIGCMDCGNTDVRVLEFDHLQDKLYNISKMHGNGYCWETIKKEIDKCDVVCANCHRIRTFSKSKSYKS